MSISLFNSRWIPVLKVAKIGDIYFYIQAFSATKVASNICLRIISQVLDFVRLYI